MFEKIRFENIRLKKTRLNQIKRKKSRLQNTKVNKLNLSTIALCCYFPFCASSLGFDQDIDIISTIKTNQRILGQVNLTIGADGELSIPSNELDLALGKVLPKESIEQIKSQAKNNKVSSIAFKAVGFPISLDPQSFELLIDIPVEQNLVNSLSLAQAKAQVAVEKPSQFNGYVNTYLRGSYVDSKINDSDSFSQSHRLKAGLNYHAANLLYEAEFLDTENTDAEFNRTFTQLSYDLPEQGTRFLLGDIVTPTTDYQTGGDILGFGIVRNFSDIPTRNLRPTATRQFTLRRNSDVNIIIDGIVIQRLTLPAGRYDLNDIPLAQGRNNVELLIEDEAGNEELISFSIAIDNKLIKQGEYEYAFTVGVPSSISDNKLSYDDSNILATAFLEYGFRTSMTIGVNAQYYNNSSQFGVIALSAWRYGTTEVLFSHVNHDLNGFGDAVRFTYSAPREFQDQYNLQFNAQYEYFSPSYTAVDQIELNTDAIVQHNTRLSLSTGFFDRYRAGLDLNFRKSYADSENNAWSASTSFSGPLANTGISFGLTARYSEEFNQNNNIDFTANFTYSFKNAHRLNARYQSSNDAFGVDYSYRNNLNTVGGYGVNANVETNRDDDLFFNGELNYTANRALLGIEHDTRFASLNSKQRVSTTSVSLDTAIAFSGKEVAIGRPVNESFMVLSPNKNLSKTPIKIKPDTKGNAHVISNNSRNVLVSDLSSYSNQTVSYEVPELPMGYDLGAGLFSVNPMLGQAYQFEIGTDAAHTLIASIIDKASNEAVSLVAGQAYQANNPNKKVDFFTSKKGRVAISGMSPGEWILELETSPAKHVTVTVIDTPEMLDQKGALYVN